jgi:predicted membrane protein
MFCPKCGTQYSSEKFCRVCGTNLSVVTDALLKSESEGSPVAGPRGRTTLAVFSTPTVTNDVQDLNGHSALSVFGGVTFDLTARPLPPGESRITLVSVFGSADILTPNDVAIRVTGMSLFSELKVRGEKVSSGVLSTGEYTSPGYASAPRQLRIDVFLLFSGFKVRR